MCKKCTFFGLSLNIFRMSFITSSSFFLINSWESRHVKEKFVVINFSPSFILVFVDWTTSFIIVRWVLHSLKRNEICNLFYFFPQKIPTICLCQIFCSLFSLITLWWLSYIYKNDMEYQFIFTYYTFNNISL